MIENKRFELKEYEDIGLFVQDNENNKVQYYSQSRTSMNKVVDKLNEQEEKIKKLEKENQGLQFKIIDMLDFIKEQGSVTREEIKQWWNKDKKIIKGSKEW